MAFDWTAARGREDRGPEAPLVAPTVRRSPWPFFVVALGALLLAFGAVRCANDRS